MQSKEIITAPKTDAITSPDVFDSPSVCGALYILIMSDVSGIYQIQSQIKPERIYIGSGVNIRRRWNHHLCDLRNNRHHSIKLQRHYGKYGESDLQFSIIEPCFPQFLIIREQHYIDTLNPFYNTCKTAGSPLGIKRSKETCNRMSVGLKGKKAWNKGKKASFESCEKMRLSHIGKNMGKDNPMFGVKLPREKLGMLNKHHTEETKEKMRQANNKKGNYIIEGISMANFCRNHNLNYQKFHDRIIKFNWPIEKAIINCEGFRGTRIPRVGKL